MVQWLRDVARPLSAADNDFCRLNIKLRSQLTDDNIEISLLLSRSARVLLSPPVDCQETKPTA